MIGLDSVEIDRIEKAVKSERFLNKVFTAEERAYYEKSGRIESLAGFWCVKEAVGKALGTGLIFPLTEVGTSHEAGGKPKVILGKKAAALLGRRAVEVSITHTNGVATAIALLTPEGG